MRAIITFEKRVALDAPVERMFVFLLDPVYRPEYQPGRFVY